MYVATSSRATLATSTLATSVWTEELTCSLQDYPTTTSWWLKCSNVYFWSNNAEQKGEVTRDVSLYYYTRSHKVFKVINKI